MSFHDSTAPCDAARHSRRWQYAIVVPMLLSILLAIAVEWIFGSRLMFQLSVYFVWMIAASIGVFTSWSAIWIVMGSGTWLRRIGTTLAIFHVAAAVLALSIEIIVVWIRGNPGELDMYQGFAGLLAGGSYAFAIHLTVSMFFIGLMKLARFHLLYFADAGPYPHPRRIAKTIPLDGREGVIALKGQVRLLDLFALTTLVALYHGGLYPLQLLLDSGGRFCFTIAFFMTATYGGVALAVNLVLIMVALMDHRGMVFQAIVNIVVLAMVCVAAFIWSLYDFRNENIGGICAIGLAIMLAFQLTLACLLRRPSNRLRFRLVRIP